MTALKVYEAIASVTKELSEKGISKDNKNMQQKYNFRGIDDIYNALSATLAKNKLCILPRIVKREVTERRTAKGGTLFYTTLTAEFDFVSAEDGSKHTVCTIGEAMDAADKSSNKAMSAAYKYACLQAFCIPTEGDNDADATTHEIASENTNRDQSNPFDETGQDQPKPCTKPQYDAITRLCEQTGRTDDFVCQQYGVTDLTKLSFEQARDAIGRLQFEASAQKEAAQ
jgi:hypothetical protein